VFNTRLISPWESTDNSFWDKLPSGVCVTISVVGMLSARREVFPSTPLFVKFK